VWFSDLKLLNADAMLIVGTSNPPHEGESAWRRLRLGLQIDLLGTKLKKRFARAMTDEEEQILKAKLAELRQEHGDLDAAIAAISDAAHCDQLQLTRLKKRKLQLKDLIARIEDSLLPDITA